MDELQDCVSQRGKPCKLYLGHTFTQKKGRENSNIWTCSNKTCKGKIVLSEGSVSVCDAHHPQCRTMSDRERERLQLKTAMKRQATDDISSRPLKLARKELVKGNYTEVCASDVLLARRCFYRKRHRSWPKIPQTKDQVDDFLKKAFEEKSIKTSNGELFLYRSEKGLSMFTCESNLRLMAQCTALMGDGTFVKASKHSYQLYTIHGYIDGFHIPLAFVPLKGKSQELYTDMWNMLLEEANNVGAFICPHAILFDFEMAAHNAVRDTSNFGPFCYVKGCRFHFSQNLTKHIRAVPTLRTAFDRKKPGESEDSAENDGPERNWLLMCSGLSCLHPSMVGEAVHQLEATMPVGAEYLNFLKYLKETYTSPNAKFPPDVWASVPTMEPATTNGAEAFHADFNAQFNAAHPNIFASISILREIQAQTYTKMNSLRAGEKNYIEPKRIEIKERRMRAWNELVYSERSLPSYLLYMGSLNAAMNRK